jgi:hypothetical protein
MVFDAREQALLQEVLAQRGPHAGELQAEIARLESAASLTRRTPRGAEQLVGELGDRPHELDLRLPPEAVFGQAFLLSKIRLFRAVGDDPETPEPLRVRAAAEAAQSIYSRLVEDIFLAVTVDADVARLVRLAAARHLEHLWSDRQLVEIDDVAPLLEAIWQARNRLRPVLGTMLGTSELVSLFQCTRDERFLDYFVRDTVEIEETQAFEEFLFGMSHEQINALRRLMNDRGVRVVSIDDARKLLGLSSSDWRPETPEPEGIHASFRARKTKASYRVLVDASGPRRTAEEYVAIAYLERGVSL